MSLLALKEWSARSVLWVMGALVLFSIVSMMVKALFWSPLKAEKKPAEPDTAEERTAQPMGPWQWVTVVSFCLAFELGRYGSLRTGVVDSTAMWAALLVNLGREVRFLTWKRFLVGLAVGASLTVPAWFAGEDLPASQRTIVTWAFACASVITHAFYLRYEARSTFHSWKTLLGGGVLAYLVWAVATWQAGLYVLTMGIVTALPQWWSNGEEHT